MKPVLLTVVAILVGAAYAEGIDAKFAKSKCSFVNHIKKTHWKHDGMRDYKGKRVYEQPLPVVSPFTNSTEEELNKQINRELFAHYTYLSMAFHFQRDDIYLPNFAKFFKAQAEEEHKHAQLLMEYQNKRGGRVKLNSIRKPCKDEWGTGLDAMEEALILEKDIYDALMGLHNHASEMNDAQMQDFLEANFLGEQIDSIQQLSRYIGTLRRLGGGMGEYLFDKHNFSL